MKKLFALLFIAGTMSIVACGPNAEQEAAAKAKVQAEMDSIANVAAAGMETAAPDSTATAPTEATETPATTTEQK